MPHRGLLGQKIQPSKRIWFWTSAVLFGVCCFIPIIPDICFKENLPNYSLLDAWVVVADEFIKTIGVGFSHFDFGSLLGAFFVTYVCFLLSYAAGWLFACVVSVLVVSKKWWDERG